MDDITRIQRYFAQKAKAQPNYRFGDMYSLVWKSSFLECALDCVLANKGSRSAGIDGVTVRNFQDPEYRSKFIQTLSQQLKHQEFQPSPGRRVYIPKDGGKKRPLGILTIQDRVVQMVLKMILEPIFEADFLECSYGFRPGRRTMDCLVPIWRQVTRTSKYYWVIEGDIRACFCSVNHRILMSLLRKRIADKRILKVIEAFLKAGVMEGQLFQHTEVGTQQGGILSPLMANLYLHQFDMWWWTNYGCLTRYQRARRRQHGLGNSILIRYADDWLLLWNGNKASAYQLKEEVRAFMERELKLELSESKTHVTHVDDGFTFLGFDIRRIHGTHGKPVVLIRPSQKNIRRLKAKIKALTQRSTTHQPAWYKVLQLNQILRGWSAYYQHVNAKNTFSKLDWWVLNRITIWARKKHGNPPWRVVAAKYMHRDPKGRSNFVCHMEDGSLVWLCRMNDKPIRRYWVDWQRPTYAQGGTRTDVHEHMDSLVKPMSYPARERDKVRFLALRRDKYSCQYCHATKGQNSKTRLHVHHIVPKEHGGTDQLDNLVTLCSQCHYEAHGTVTVTVSSQL